MKLRGTQDVRFAGTMDVLGFKSSCEFAYAPKPLKPEQ
jgi:hypothetical protein